LHRECLLKVIIGGMIEVMETERRRCKQLLDDLKQKRWYRKLQEEALAHTLWRTQFGGGYGPLVRQSTE
jgi:hypothetical protein